jgi:hypothetical protein
MENKDKWMKCPECGYEVTWKAYVEMYLNSYCIGYGWYNGCKETKIKDYEEVYH